MVGRGGVVQARGQLGKFGASHMDEASQRVDSSHSVVNRLYEDCCCAICDVGLHISQQAYVHYTR